MDSHRSALMKSVVRKGKLSCALQQNIGCVELGPEQEDLRQEMAWDIKTQLWKWIKLSRGESGEKGTQTGKDLPS